MTVSETPAAAQPAVPPADERSDLIQALQGQRRFLRQTVRDLDDEQAGRRTTVSALCLGGIVKHLTSVEAGWTDFIVRGPEAIGPADEAAMEAHEASFRMDGESLASLLAAYDEVGGRTDELVASLPSLDASHPLPEAPWYPPGARWSARRTLTHILSETAHHCGHADIIREALDGAKTMG